MEDCFWRIEQHRIGPDEVERGRKLVRGFVQAGFEVGLGDAEAHWALDDCAIVWHACDWVEENGVGVTGAERRYQGQTTTLQRRLRRRRRLGRGRRRHGACGGMQEGGRRLFKRYLNHYARAREKVEAGTHNKTRPSEHWSTPPQANFTFVLTICNGIIYYNLFLSQTNFIDFFY